MCGYRDQILELHCHCTKLLLTPINKYQNGTESKRTQKKTSKAKVILKVCHDIPCVIQSHPLVEITHEAQEINQGGQMTNKFDFHQYSLVNH